MINSCPYVINSEHPTDGNHWWCSLGDDNAKNKKDYDYSLFTVFANIAYWILTGENTIYLAKFKDVIFCIAVVSEFCGMFYFTKVQDLDKE